MRTIVLDTNVFVSALRSGGGASRQVLRRILQGQATPLFGNTLWQEYQDLLGRDVWTSATTPEERLQVLAALAQASRWVHVYYGWRPNLPDEADNHLFELAIAAGAPVIVSRNTKDLARGELRFASPQVQTPEHFIQETCA